MNRRPEALLERQVLAALGRDPLVTLFKNECGEGFYGAVRPQLSKLLAGMTSHRDALAILDRNRVHFGLHNGSADLIAVVGPRGRLVGIELKSDRGVLSADQERWLARMRELGAVAGVARTPGDAALLIEEAKR